MYLGECIAESKQQIIILYIMKFRIALDMLGNVGLRLFQMEKKTMTDQF